MFVCTFSSGEKVSFCAERFIFQVYFISFKCWRSALKLTTSTVRQLSYLRAFLSPLGTNAWWNQLIVADFWQHKLAEAAERRGQTSVLYFLAICFSEKIKRENISTVMRKPTRVNTQIVASRPSLLSYSLTPLPTRDTFHYITYKLWKKSH